jgi:N-formylglutamate amidohydrolase
MTPPRPALNAAFSLTPARGPGGPLVFASPHSGRMRPDDMRARADLSEASLCSAEDRGVDALIAWAPDLGAALLAATISRTYVDLNRARDTLDPALIDDVAETIDPRVRAGYGVIPRLTGDGHDIHDRRLSRAEAQGRLETAHRPYHAALSQLMQAARSEHGRAILIDWHSMPARAGGADVVLGDRHGTSCQTALTRRMRTLFEREGLSVALNHPYAGGWSTQAWGRPQEGYEALQIELNRALYWDEAAGRPGVGMARLSSLIRRVAQALTAQDWR